MGGSEGWALNCRSSTNESLPRLRRSGLEEVSLLDLVIDNRRARLLSGTSGQSDSARDRKFRVLLDTLQREHDVMMMGLESVIEA